MELVSRARGCAVPGQSNPSPSTPQWATLRWIFDVLGKEGGVPRFIAVVALFFARTLSSFPLSDAKETDSIADSILSSMFASLGAELETCPVNLLPFKYFVKFLCSRPISDTPAQEYQPSKLNHPETSLVKANPRVPESM